MIWQVLFVIGVIIMTVGVWGGPPYCGRVAWLLWTIAALIWLLDPSGIAFHSSRLAL
jgi:hypothetical protein